MARQNRIVLEDATYHLVTRVAHRAHLLAPPEVKDLIVTWMYGIADFCGVNILAWTVLDNHLHIEAEVPSVPERYWNRGTVPAASPLPTGTVPAAVPAAAGPCPSAFSMRPAECRAPRWQPDLADLAAARAAGTPLAITPAGDSPSEEAVRLSVAEGVPVATLPRPATGFSLTDGEMLARLARLYDGTRASASAVADRWARLRYEGRHDEVEAEKDRLCRRMYNVSQFMKTLKQRITEHFNRDRGHSGQLWQGRFYSGVVDRDALARTYLTAYVDWNAPKAKLARRPQDWRWCSFATACGNGRYAERALLGYERALGCPWEEARARLEAIFDEGLPEGYDPAADAYGYTVRNPDGTERRERLTLPQLVKAVSRLFSAALVSRRREFAEEVAARLPRRFPATPGDGTVDFLGSFDWTEPWRKAA